MPYLSCCNAKRIMKCMLNLVYATCLSKLVRL